MERSRTVRASQLWNMADMSVTFAVLKLETLRLVRALQKVNIKLMSVTAAVLK